MMSYCTVIINAPAIYTALRNSIILINRIILQPEHGKKFNVCEFVNIVEERHLTNIS